MRQVLLLVALALFGAGAAVGLIWSTERRWSRWASLRGGDGRLGPSGGHRRRLCLGRRSDR